MRRIYSEAFCVYVDLGDADSSFYTGLDLMVRLALIRIFERNRGDETRRNFGLLRLVYGLPGFESEA